jgi:EAL domain-containing protein (putative c-di-GMP-specific phosphodiesterase class I)
MVGTEVAADVEEAAQVRALLAPGGVTAEFQPIVVLADRTVHAWEALGRTAAGAAEDLAPDVALAMAERVGRSADLEVAFWDAVVAAGPPPGRAALFVNVSAAALADPRIAERLAALPPYVVVEITEQVAAADDGALALAVARWSAVGVRFAVDDIGAGYSSFRRVLDLEPAYLKLDASLVHGLAADPRLRAALEAVAGFASAMDATLVAEGVERSDDLEVLIDRGVELAQGFLLGRPGPPWAQPNSVQVDLTSPT